MKSITGVDLNKVLNQAEETILADKTQVVVEKVKQLLTKIESATQEVEKAKKNLESKERELTKLTDKLEAVKKGDWNALDDKAQE